MKNFLIIGGSSGIGLELVKILSQDNNVFATYNTNHKNFEGVEYFYWNAREESLNSELLPAEIHGLVYLPGNIRLKPFTRFKKEDFISDYSLQVGGAIDVIQHVLPKLKASGNASVVLFSTVAVKMGFPFHSLISSSKGAIEGLTKALAAEFAPTIRFNAIAPSITKTPLASSLLSSEEKIQANAERHPLKKIGNPSEIASFVAFLLSDNAQWITGQIHAIDGGISSIKS
jgi:NAD(P)-dependent dehydrogenase (short-subunit alcohol dehydrogenase family)